MPAKRVAQKAKSPPAKVARTQASPSSKAARAEAPPPVPDECAPVYALLAEADDITEESRRMLQAAAPHCLATPIEDRHEYQLQMVQALATIGAGVQAKRQAAIDAVTAQIDGQAAGSEAAKACLCEAVSEAEAKKGLRDEQAKESGKGSVVVAAAKAALLAEQAGIKSHVAEQKVARDDEAFFSKVLSEMWTPLQAGFPGKEWRQRDKLLIQFLKSMENLNLDASLTDAIPVVIKTKPADRGSFAQSTLDFAENELRKHIAALAEKVSIFDEEAARCAAAFAESEAAFASALTAQATCVDLHFAAEKEFSDAEARRDEAKDAVDDLEPAVVRRQVELEAARAALASVELLVARFEELRVRRRPAPMNTEDLEGEEVASEVPAPEVPAPQVPAPQVPASQVPASQVPAPEQ